MFDSYSLYLYITSIKLKTNTFCSFNEMSMHYESYLIRIKTNNDTERIQYSCVYNYFLSGSLWMYLYVSKKRWYSLIWMMFPDLFTHQIQFSSFGIVLLCFWTYFRPKAVALVILVAKFCVLILFFYFYIKVILRISKHIVS